MKKLFTLTDLIITIVILSILAVIILLNINNLNEKAKITSLNADKRNIQLAVDKYNLDKGYCPSVIKPTLGNPQAINFEELYTDYLKRKPQYKDAFYWVDVNCLVYVSLIDAPTDVSVDVPNGTITWTPHKDSSKSIIHIKRPNGNLKVVEENTTGNYVGEDGKEHLVSEEDKYGLDTPPVGEDYIGYPKSPIIDNSDENNPEGPIVPCDTDGYICIYTAEELASIGVDSKFPLIENYRLANNIDLINYENWTPIGYNTGYYFEGAFDGNGFHIDNLTSSLKDSYSGLFSSIEESSIKNVTLNNVNVEGNRSVGGFVGNVRHTVFENISVNGKITGLGGSWESFGGIAGNTSEITMKNIEFNGEVNAPNAKAGGIVGVAYKSILENISVNGKVLGGSYSGGIIGNVSNLKIKDAEFNGEMIGSSSSEVGGIIGYGDRVNATNLKAYGKVEGGRSVGGVFGNASNTEAANLHTQVNVIAINGNGGGIAGYSNDSKYVDISSKGNFYGFANMGGLMGYTSSVSIHSSNVEGSIKLLNSNEYSNEDFYSSYGYYGGLIGMASSTEIEDSNYKGDIQLEIENSRYVGGAIGYVTQSKMSDISVQSNLYTWSGYVGGVIGYNNNSELKHIDYNGTINAKGENVGGLAGYANYLNISDSYIKGEVVNNNQYTGGLLGYSIGGEFNRVYSEVFVESIGHESVNALFGYIETSDNVDDYFNDIYWNSEISNQLYSSLYKLSTSDSLIRANTSNYTTGKHLSLAERRDKENYKNWNFNSIWEYEDGLPKLRKNISSVDNSEFVSNLWFKDCNVIFNGKGTESSPYKIKTYKDFSNLKYCTTSYFELENDLIIDGKNHTSIKGFKWEYFGGSIDGKNHTITATNLKEPLFGDNFNLTIKNVKFKDITMDLNVLENLIAYTADALTLDNVVFENIKIDSDYSASIIASSCYHCSISNTTLKDSSIKSASKKANGTNPATAGGLFRSVVAGSFKNIDLINVSVEGGHMTGGLVGAVNYNEYVIKVTTFENITMENVLIKGKDAYVGGLIGYGKNYKVDKVTGNVDVRGYSEVGGIVGESSNGIISDIQMNDLEENIIVVSDSYYAGGISGYMLNSSISNVNITGNVTGKVYFSGGIYGLQSKTTKQNVLFKGKVNNAFMSEN